MSLIEQIKDLLYRFDDPQNPAELSFISSKFEIADNERFDATRALVKDAVVKYSIPAAYKAYGKKQGFFVVLDPKLL
ncbi:MAG: hypothetical protein INQ03_01345 [Candidatus Heimdallarchaeota archaeon]|nr:hypothetical protein [Candidatus Heimdallarchaeota archaeon]